MTVVYIKNKKNNNFFQHDISYFMNYKNTSLGEAWFQDRFLGW